MNTLSCLLLSLPCLLQPSPPRAGTQAPARSEHQLEAVGVGSTKNVHRLGNLWFAGQFPQEDVARWKAAGIRRVITLRQAGEVDWDEPGQVRAAGMEFVDLGFREPETMSDEILDRLRALLADESTPTLLHCGSANRVGGAWIPFRVLDQGVSLEQAAAEAKEIGLRTTGYQDRAEAYIELRGKESGKPEPGARPGLNDAFKDPDLDVDAFVARFEVESREIYAARRELVAALRLEPGMRVADVGAGTGLFTFPCAEAVGAGGWVFAVDIAPRFIQHILTLAGERRVENVTGVLCPETSVSLPPASVDLAYVCDTYHHFEFPGPTASSLLRALVPGGRLVVVDFERIPGVSREWTLEHVRAGKETVRAEIEAAGFAFVRELEVPGLTENYVLEFQKPAR